MSNLLASLSTAGSALDVYQKALAVIQNNITNSATPGFAKQRLSLEARPFDLASGLLGGVAARGLDSARDEYAEEAVRGQVQSLGRYETQAKGALSIESLFDISGTSGIPAGLDQLFQSFSAWSVAPNSAVARQTVIASAGTLADSVRRLSASLAATAQGIRSQIGSTVDQFNELTSTIQQYNLQRLKQTSPDPGLDANMHSALEQLSQLADVSELTQADGTVTVLLNGGSPLVLGDTQYPIASNALVPAGAVNPMARASAEIMDSQGNRITSQIQSGNLGGLLDIHNRVLPSLVGDGQQTGSLNQFAQTFADAVNGILQSGFTATGSGASPGSALFVYDHSDPTAAAGSLSVNPNIAPADLAPVDSQGNSNGNALQLAALATSSNAIGGLGFGDFFSGIAAAVGRESATAQNNQQTQQQVVAQVRSLRDQTSRVSLDEQAVMLLEFQRSYQAVARLLTTLNDVAETTINLIR